MYRMVPTWVPCYNSLIPETFLKIPSGSYSGKNSKFFYKPANVPQDSNMGPLLYVLITRLFFELSFVG